MLSQVIPSVNDIQTDGGEPEVKPLNRMDKLLMSMYLNISNMDQSCGEISAVWTS